MSGRQASQAPRGSHMTRHRKPGMTFQICKCPGSRGLSCLLKPGLGDTDEISLYSASCLCSLFLFVKGLAAPSPTRTRAL